jgi:hypothetical protein
LYEVFVPNFLSIAFFLKKTKNKIKKQNKTKETKQTSDGLFGAQTNSKLSAE